LFFFLFFFYAKIFFKCMFSVFKHQLVLETQQNYYKLGFTSFYSSFIFNTFSEQGQNHISYINATNK
jgi:hypothetical protein